MADARDRTVLVIGIGAGDPGHLTVAAVEAMRRADAFFLVDKGEDKDDLAGLRRELLARHVPDGTYRLVEVPDPERDRSAADYPRAVAEWQRARQAAYRDMIAGLAPGEAGAFLVWGDPSLYDGTLRILDGIAAEGTVAFAREVVPGISAVSALAARHAVPLNQVGAPFLVTTGRRLAACGVPDGIDDVVVMLDAQEAFRTVADDPAWHVYWGAYLGTPDELLVSGPVRECADEIAAVRARARAAKGWIMDTYLLRRAR